jgi:hypothetical protein
VKGADRERRGHAGRLAAGFLLAAALLGPRAARGDGAFPDSQSILTLASRPNEIALVTNFGVVLSEDAGQTWLWSCEQAENSLGYLYQYGAPPRNRMFALSGDKLAHTDDETCGWQVAGGLATGRGLTDFFPDPSNADRVLAVAFDYGATTNSVLASDDAGTTFASVLFTTAPRDGISGVEIARSDPRTIYITTSITATNGAMLVRSTDGGVTWQSDDLSPTLGPGTARIIAVDPADAQRVLLLFRSPASQSLALTRDGGKTVATVLAPSGSAAYFNSYARTASGTVLIGGSDAAANPILYASHDGGQTFAPLTNQPPHIRALAARGPSVYAATDNFGDGYALGISSDEGSTWRPLMSFDQMGAIIGCLKASCQALCEQQATMGLWSESTCTADAPALSVDAGADASSAGDRDAGAGTGGATGAGGARGGGSSCAVAPGNAGAGAAAGLWWIALGLCRCRRPGRYRHRYRHRRGRGS